MSNPYQSSADVGSDGDLSPHITGNPITGGRLGNATFTIGHTWLIIVGALVLLWLMGGVMFKSIRMS